MPGRIVKTKSGQGQTNNDDEPINGKIKVYLEDGKKILCNPKDMEPIGFWDDTFFIKPKPKKS